MGAIAENGSGSGPAKERNSEVLEPQASTQAAEPRESTHQDERGAQHEVSGHPGRTEERFEAVASSAAASGRKQAQHDELQPQPSR